MAGGPSTLTVRPADLEDAAGIAGVHVTSWREAYGGILPDAMLAAMTVESRTVMWQRLLSEPPASLTTRAYVAAQPDGAIVAFGSCCHQRDPALAENGFPGEVAAIYVLQSAQRQGAGTGLMRRMAQDLHARGLDAASLWVLDNNDPARRFYEHLGGVVAAEKSETRWGMVLQEVAYGWPDLRMLLPD